MRPPEEDRNEWNQKNNSWYPHINIKEAGNTTAYTCNYFVIRISVHSFTHTVLHGIAAGNKSP